MEGRYDAGVADPFASYPKPGAADPASLRIVHYPNEVLRLRARPVEGLERPEVRANVEAVVRRMITLMAEAEGVGLAAPQVGLPWRLFVAHIPKDEDHDPDGTPPTGTHVPTAYINPELTRPEGALEPYAEGCLSLPDIRGDVLRPAIVTISALGVDGERFTLKGGGLLARCWQHEVDHLDGVLIIDRMTQASRLKCRAAIRDLERGER